MKGHSVRVYAGRGEVTDDDAIGGRTAAAGAATMPLCGRTDPTMGRGGSTDGSTGRRDCGPLFSRERDCGPLCTLDVNGPTKEVTPRSTCRAAAQFTVGRAGRAGNEEKTSEVN